MKKILLLTRQYPYEKGETFIEPELKYGCEIASIDIIAASYFGSNFVTKSTITLSENINVVRLFDSQLYILGKLFWGFIAICQRCFWEEIRVLHENGKLGLNIIRELIAHIGRGERIYFKLRKIYKEELESDPNNTIVYSYWMLDTAYSAAKLKIKYGCKAITRAHGGDLYNERSHIGYQPLRKFLLKNLDAVYCISHDGKKYLESRYGFHDKIHVSRLGTENFGCANTTRRDEFFVIVSCAYLIPIKRIHLIALALKKLGEDHSNINIKWIHFGNGSEFANIKKIILSFPKNVVSNLMGDRQHREIMDYYKTQPINLFINTSSFEGIPVSIMEAISFGIPVIATDVGGSREIVRHEYNGWLISDQITPPALAANIKAVIDLPKDQYYLISNNAMKLWKENYSADINFTDFYRNL